MMVYVPLYPEYGGPARGFRCEQCERVTRTVTGIKMHLLRRHNIRIQGVLFNDPQPTLPQAQPELPQTLDAPKPGNDAKDDSRSSL